MVSSPAHIPDIARESHDHSSQNDAATELSRKALATLEEPVDLGYGSALISKSLQNFTPNLTATVKQNNAPKLEQMVKDGHLGYLSSQQDKLYILLPDGAVKFIRSGDLTVNLPDIQAALVKQGFALEDFQVTDPSKPSYTSRTSARH